MIRDLEHKMIENKTQKGKSSEKKKKSLGDQWEYKNNLASVLLDSQKGKV